MKIFKIARVPYDDLDNPCPKCGFTSHFIPNPSNPTIYECASCKYMWNPSNESAEDNLSDIDADSMTLRDVGWGTDEDYGPSASEIL